VDRLAYGCQLLRLSRLFNACRVIPSIDAAMPWLPPARSSALLISDPNCWVLHPGEAWHGFKQLEDGYCMLDPIKVSVVSVTPPTPSIMAAATSFEAMIAYWGEVDACIINDSLNRV
jgi:hypothetical protein